MNKYAILFVILISGLAFAGITGMTLVDARIGDGTSDFGKSGKIWILNWVGSGTDFVSGSLSPQELQDKSGTASKQDFKVTMTSGNEFATYDFVPRGDVRPVVKLDLISTYVVNNGINNPQKIIDDYIANNCYDIDGNGAPDARTVNSFGVLYGASCYHDNGQLAQMSGVGAPREIFNTEWTFQAGDKAPIKMTITNANGNTCNVQGLTNCVQGTTVRLPDPNPVIIVKWQGNLQTGATYDQAGGNVLGAQSNAFGGWRVTDYSRFFAWQNDLRSTGITKLSTWSSCTLNCDSVKNDILNGFNNEAQEAVLPTTIPQFKDYQITKNDLTNGQFKIDKGEGVTIPSFQVLVDASYLELSIPTGKPQILDVTNNLKVGENSLAKLSIQGKNIGSQKGDFVFSVSCSNEFTVNTLKQQKTLDINAVSQVDFDISFAATDTVSQHSGTCTATMQESTTGETVSKTVTVTGIQASECTPDKEVIRIEGGVQVVYRCNSDGLTFTKIKACASDETAVIQSNGHFDCIKNHGPDIVPNFDLNAFLAKVTGALVLAGLIIGALWILTILIPIAILATIRKILFANWKITLVIIAILAIIFVML